MDWMCFYMCETVHVEIVRNGKVIISRKRITGMCYYITKYKGQYKTTELHFTRGRGWACVLLWDVSKLYNSRFWISLWNPAIYYCHRFCFWVMVPIAINAMSSCLCFFFLFYPCVCPILSLDCYPTVFICIVYVDVHLFCGFPILRVFWILIMDYPYLTLPVSFLIPATDICFDFFAAHPNKQIVSLYALNHTLPLLTTCCD